MMKKFVTASAAIGLALTLQVGSAVADDGAASYQRIRAIYVDTASCISSIITT